MFGPAGKAELPAFIAACSQVEELWASDLGNEGLRLFTVWVGDPAANPDMILRQHIPIGSPHPTKPHLAAARYTVEERLLPDLYKVSIEYRPLVPATTPGPESLPLWDDPRSSHRLPDLIDTVDKAKPWDGWAFLAYLGILAIGYAVWRILSW